MNWLIAACAVLSLLILDSWLDSHDRPLPGASTEIQEALERGRAQEEARFRNTMYCTPMGVIQERK